MILDAVEDYRSTAAGPLKVYRCPHCNAWDYALTGDHVQPGAYDCDECRLPFRIEGEP